MNQDIEPSYLFLGHFFKKDEPQVIVSCKKVIVGYIQIIVGDKKVMVGDKKVIVGYKKVIVGDIKVILRDKKRIVGDTKYLFGNKKVMVEKDAGKRASVMRLYPEAIYLLQIMSAKGSVAKNIVLER